MLEHQFAPKKPHQYCQGDRPRRSYARVTLLASIFLSGSLLHVLPALAASPTAGTVIDNQATGSFIDSTDNTEQQTESNIVKVTVAEITGLTVTPTNTPSATTGGTSNFDFTVTNVGNDPTQFFIPGAPSTITGGTAGTLKIVAYDPDGSGPAAAVDLTGNNVTVPAGGQSTGTLLSAIAAANNGSIPVGASIVVRVPVTITATNTQTVSVTLGNTSGQPSNTNTPYILGANGSGSQDLYTVDNADGAAGEAAGAPLNGDATNHRQEASATQTATVANPLSVSGTIYKDNDRNGTNNSEPGIGSVRVILYKDTDNNRELSPSEIVQQTTTLADGSYQFTNVPAGTYQIKVDIADTNVPFGYTLGTPDNLTVTVNTTSITGQNFGFYPPPTCEWEAQVYSGHYAIPGANYAKDQQPLGLFGTGGLPTLRGTAKFGAGAGTFTFNDKSIGQTNHPLRTIINGTFPSQGYVAINGDYISTQTNFGQPSWAIVLKRQATAAGRITLGQAGAYIDDAMEIYVNGVRVGNPVLTYTPSLAANKVSTVAVNAGDIVEIRLSNYDNVGGFFVSAAFAYDFGDAPASYGEVSQATDCSNPHLGATSTGESSQAYSANASGDAGDDGVTLPASLAPGSTATITVNASTAGFLNSWIDFNGNGVFDSGEQLTVTNVTTGAVATTNNVPLAAGNNTLTFTVPAGATLGSSFARFRFTTATVATPSPTGAGDAGEVEDYPVTLAGIADLSITKTDGQTSTTPGSAIAYTITVTNNGPNTVNSVTVNDAVPASIQSPVFTPSTGSYNNGTGAWTGLNFASGQSITLTVSGTVAASATGTITNTATVAPPTGITDPNLTNNSATDTTTLTTTADLKLTKTVDVPSPPVGSTLKYTVTVTNNGPSSATNVAIKDLLPASVTYTSSTPSQGTYSNSTGLWSVGTIANGSSATLQIAVIVNTGGPITNTAEVSASDQPDPNSTPGNNNPAENDQASVTTPFTSPRLQLVKRITAINGVPITTIMDDSSSTADNAPNWPAPVDATSGISTYLTGATNGGTIRSGDILEYTIYFLSDGGTAATNISLCDLVPTNSTFVPDSFSSVPESGINLTIGSTSTNLTNVPDADGGQFFNPGGKPSVSCSGTNTNGAVVVNVVKSPANLPSATAPGTPTNSYGFIRFRAKVN